MVIKVEESRNCTVAHRKFQQDAGITQLLDQHQPRCVFIHEWPLGMPFPSFVLFKCFPVYFSVIKLMTLTKECSNPDLKCSQYMMFKITARWSHVLQWNSFLMLVNPPHSGKPVLGFFSKCCLIIHCWPARQRDCDIMKEMSTSRLNSGAPARDGTREWDSGGMVAQQ